MARFSLFVVAAAFCVALTAAAPIPRAAFALLDYADFQISDGVGGDAAAKANSVFVDPFAGVDLATVDAATIDDIETMRQAAEAAEVDQFNPAIAAATGAEADALQVGKIQNKVLKLTGFIQKANIQLAQADAADKAALTAKIAEEQKKLDTNIATDKASAGETSQSIV